MATKRKFNPGSGDVQQSLSQGDLRPTMNQRIPAYGPTPSDWTQIAEAMIPPLMQVINGALCEALSTRVDTERDVAPIVARQCLRWWLPPQLFHTALTFVADCCGIVHEQNDPIADFFQQLAPLQYPGVCYEVFHNGRSHLYYDELPTEILDLKETFLFWIDHSKNEWRSRGELLSKNERLEPKAEALLRFLCLAERAGEVVSFEDLYLAVWGKPGSSAADSIPNAINVRQTSVNRFAAKKFIVGTANSSRPTDKKIGRLRGQGAYLIGKHAYEELCIVRSIRRE